MKTNDVGRGDAPAIAKISFADVAANDDAAIATEKELNVSDDVAVANADSIAEDDIYYSESNPAVQESAEDDKATKESAEEQNESHSNASSQINDDEDFKVLVKREAREQVSKLLQKLSKRVERALEEGFVKGRNAAIEQRWPELKGERKEKQPLERLFRRRESVWK